MEGSSNNVALPPTAAPDNIKVGRWFAVYFLCLAAVVAVVAMMLSGTHWTWTWRPTEIGKQLAEMSPMVKVLIFLAYGSLCCTLLPLPMPPIVAAIATADAAITGELWSTTFVVATIGAIASTIGNLHDYHLFTLMLRSEKVAKIRHTRMFISAEKWFRNSPFLINIVLNILPIPGIICGTLATVYRYPILKFTAGNFLGRFIRYAVIAFATFLLGKAGWIAIVALAGLAVAMAMFKAIKFLINRKRSAPAKANEMLPETAELTPQPVTITEEKE